MAIRDLIVVLFVIGSVAGQTYRVCVTSTENSICNPLERAESQVVCRNVESRVDCALQLARNEADFGVFSEDEILLLAQQQPNDHRVVATIRDAARLEPNAFEAVAVVSNGHTNGFEGLRNSRYCHPGFDQTELRWSPRVLKAFEQAVARTDRCPATTADKSADELEVEILSEYFSAACRPGSWSVNTTVDDNLKTRYPKLCSLCGITWQKCTGYTLDMGVTVAGVSNVNRHIQALECLRSNGNNTVAYVAWQHVREFFTVRNPEAATSFALLCPDGSTRNLTTELLASNSSPCAFVRQPWRTVVASASVAAALQTNMRVWWPTGTNPNVAGTWQTILYNGVIGGASARVVHEGSLVTPATYLSTIRNLTNIDATASCLPARRWCTLSAQEQLKCNWVRNAAYVIGVQPTISCQQRSTPFECLGDIRDDRADFFASRSNYGYLARQHFRLSPVKLVQNLRTGNASSSRVAAFVKETSTTTISRFENLRGKKACFPEYGGIAYVAFVRAAHERSVISSSECDYAKAVGEFFDGACAPGAVDAQHALGESSFNTTTLCTACQPAVAAVGNNSNNFICSWDYTNKYFGNNGSLACLSDPATDIAVLQTQDIVAKLAQVGLQASQIRALCRNNTLASTTGVNIDDNCLLAHVVDSEVITRRNDPHLNALNVLLDNLDTYFGYAAESGTQFINLEIFSPFDGISDLLFRDSAVSFSEPTSATTNEAARNYIELFQHLESCTGAAPPSPGTPGFATRNMYSMFTVVIMGVITRFLVY